MPRPITIIGGGLAGLTLGIGLRQRELPVTIHEAGSYPRHRVCGEFISGRGQAVIQRLGLLPAFQKAGAVPASTAMFVCGAARSPVRPLPLPAICLSRYKMDALLASAFQQLGGDLRVNSRQTFETGAEGVVTATGRRLQPANNATRWFGIKAHVSRAREIQLDADLEMHLSRDGYIGVNRISGDEINVCGLFRARPDHRPSDSKTEWLRGPTGALLHERLAGAAFEADSFCAVAGIQLKRQAARGNEECRIGDALTMTPPVTGNGMSMAFESAEIAIEPLAAYSRGQMTWAQARQQIAARCDITFSGRLSWAQLLQWMMISPLRCHGIARFMLRSDLLWRLMFDRTR